MGMCLANHEITQISTRFLCQSREILCNLVVFFGSLVIRECKHFFTLPEAPVVVRKIKPQSAQRITESCYFYLSPPLCSLSVDKKLHHRLPHRLPLPFGVILPRNAWMATPT
uniref:Uncharacterized protein n=1 Tax=Candidatus Methanogaster sp. ANME-2c ERB4 TaxID=2759911 RepID=A0A7G9XZW5_9EURY|nr:hypothetical protein ABHFMKGO_00003 [Methanosarcinales archaeon ANME-2c ERB4]QNO48125.1 hypothetical protein LLFDKFJJ_00009 [Methanosarcinales archaeon ANME-2c ERB4]